MKLNQIHRKTADENNVCLLWATVIKHTDSSTRLGQLRMQSLAHLLKYSWTLGETLSLRISLRLGPSPSAFPLPSPFLDKALPATLTLGLNCDVSSDGS